MIAEPPFVDATSYWDEPTYAQEKLISPFTSAHFFFVQIKWTISNLIKFSGMLNTMSVFTYLIVFGFIFYLYKKRCVQPIKNELLIFLTGIIYPSGYMLLFIEWRYVWLIPILLLLMSGILLQEMQFQQWLKQRWMALATLCIMGSFLYQPLNELKDLSNNNKDVFEMADAFKKAQIKGKFLLNYKSFLPYGKTVVLCYLTGSQLYGPAILDYNFEEFKKMQQQYGIQYYLYYYDFPSEKEIFLKSDFAQYGTKIYENLYPGIVVVEYK
jgi:hypothetical protein